MTKGKKFIIALAIIVLLAVISVVIIVCLPKNVNDVRDRAFKEAETSFLQSDEERNMYSSFTSKIQISASQYIKNADDAKTVSNMLVNVLDFYNEFLVFAKDNKTYQAQYRVVLDAFNSANSYQKSMNSLLKDVYEYVGNDTTYITGAWQKFEKDYFQYVEYYVKALEGLGKVYIDCVPSGFNNNALTSLVINTTTDYLKVISTGKDNYSAVVAKAENFIDKYILDTSLIEKYEFSSNLKTTVTNINSFETIYKDSVISVINSINNSGITYKIRDTDKTGALASLKSFLEGGLNA